MSALAIFWLSVALVAALLTGWFAHRDYLPWRFYRAAEADSAADMTAAIEEASGMAVTLKGLSVTEVEP